jgi:2-C-methyl-D-erythritol 4-phosphate cytidylyltransferase
VSPSPAAAGREPAPRGRALVVTAAGASARMAGGDKKEYRDLRGVPVLARAILPFLAFGGFAPIIVTVPPGDARRAAELLRPHLDAARLLFVEGGGTRQESVRRALEAIAEGGGAGSVLIHDGARPWITPAVIGRVLAAAEARGACVPVVEVSEALKRAGEDGVVEAHEPRGAYRLAQTPQGFRFDAIRAAHGRALIEGLRFVDDAEVYAAFVGPVAWVPGDPSNRKVTWPSDLEGA